MTAVSGAAFTAAQFNTHVRDNLLETAPAKATTANGLFVATGLHSIEEQVVATQTSWVPTWTNVTVGAGTLTTAYRLILGICTWRLRLVFAADTNVSGVIQVTAPETANLGQGNVIGWGFVDDASAGANRRVVSCRLANSTAFNLFYDGGSVNATTPIPWATSDQISVGGVYESTSEFP